MADDPKRIQELQAELASCKEDIQLYRQELRLANQRLAALVERLQGEVDMVHKIQRALIPTEFPHIPGFDFSTKFIASKLMGGDYYDIFEHEDRMHFGVMMSSASDHTTSALLLSVLLKMTGQVEVRRNTDPLAWVQKIHEEMAQKQTHTGLDLFCGIFDRRQFEFKYVAGGTIAAFLQVYGSSEIQALHTESAPITASEKLSMQTKTVSLGPRDRLIFCSRGSVEAKNPKGESFGWERLIKAVKDAPPQGVHEIRNQILFQLQHFGETTELVRDQSVVVVEVKDRVIRLATRG